jgi:hypothetical protein
MKFEVPVKCPNLVARPELLTKKLKTQPPEPGTGGPKFAGICPDTVPLNGTWSPATAGVVADENRAKQARRPVD